MLRFLIALTLLYSLSAGTEARAQPLERDGRSGLLIAENGMSEMVIVVSPDAGPWEKKAATDLVKYTAMMTGARLPIVTAVEGARPAIFLGKSALAVDPQTAAELKRVAKTAPIVQADAISVRRDGNRLFVAGSNDDSHYFAVSWLLQQWGCRWYMPTDFGEVVPKRRRLAVGQFSFAYAPPFEIRRYWLSWNGDSQGADDFQRRNFMSAATVPGHVHALSKYTADLAPPGRSHFNVPFADPRTAEHVSAKVEADYAAGKDISLSIADGIYSNDHPADRALVGEYDPYFLKPSLTDAMMTLYNDVSRRLSKKYPLSRSKIGGMAYVNVTLPPRKVRSVESNIVMWLAPIDIDPNHAMDDPRSPPRVEYRAMVEQWARLLPGRLAIYDYDQGMLVWRDLPNPSHGVFARDVKIYRDAGLLGIQTESRGALATTFLNLFFRGQLMWNPELQTGELLEEFYRGFYGPAAVPMARYWNRIFDAWDRTAVTEHEYLAIPAIYTPALVAALRADLVAGEVSLNQAGGVAGAAAVMARRMAFTRASFTMIETYVATALAAARDADYSAATEAGAKALAAQSALKTLSPLHVSGAIGVEDQTAWLAGEVRQYAKLKALTDGTTGTLVSRLPLTWSFKVEQPLPAGWRYDGAIGPVPAGDAGPAAEAITATNRWRDVTTDLYLQGQGVVGPGGQSPLGYYWYRTTLDVDARNSQAKLHLKFPGLLNEAWLYVNGRRVAHRSYREPWWRSDYDFEWDVDVSEHLRPGANEIAVKGFNPHHWGGMFRRPFLYRPK